MNDIQIISNLKAGWVTKVELDNVQQRTIEELIALLPPAYRPTFPDPEGYGYWVRVSFTQKKVLGD